MLELIRHYEFLVSISLALALGFGCGAWFLGIFAILIFYSRSPYSLSKAIGWFVFIGFFAFGILPFAIGMASYERYSFGSGFEGVLIAATAIFTIYLGNKFLRPRFMERKKATR